MKKILATVAMCLFAVAAHAGQATEAEAKALAEKAAKFVETKGIDAAVKAFNKGGDPEFADRDLYVIMWKQDGMTLAHGFKPQLVGTNRKNVVDANGDAYMQRVLATKTGATGWVDYYFQNPATSAVEHKNTYVIHVTNPDVLVGVGAYKND
jgi:cytochrome c